MKSKSLLWATGIVGLLVVAGVTCVVAGTRAPNHFAGVINDYTAVAGGTGPWEVRGPWTLDVDERTGKAEFSAAVTMELTDFALSGANIGTSGRTQHTHHLTVVGGTVTSITNGFEVTGPVTIDKRWRCGTYEHSRVEPRDRRHRRIARGVFKRCLDVPGRRRGTFWNDPLARCCSQGGIRPRGRPVTKGG